MKALSFTVPGIPVPQGSKNTTALKAGGQYTGKVAVYEANAVKLKPWREGITLLARRAVVKHGFWQVLEGPVVVGLRFYLPRPASVPRLRRPFMTVKPDLDKLTRAVLDALTTAKVYGDDARVIELHLYKNYADDCPPGVKITVEEPEGPE